MSSFYAGVCISSIKPKYGPDSNGIVRFSENDATGDKAMFLHLVREIGDISRSSGSKEFEATVIDYAKAKEIIEKEDTSEVKLVPIFCVHGFFVEPNALFNNLNPQIQRFVDGKKYYPVPVLWPCRTNTYVGAPGRNYEIDQTTTSQSAGVLFKQMADLVPNNLWPKKALMMHSMGNHVVFNGACAAGTPDATFDDIFMVAADIEFDSFHKNPERNGEGVFANKKQKAQNFLGLLGDGKIHVLHNVHDRALLGSANYTNSEYRLGQRGIGMYKASNLSWYDDKQRDLALSEIFDSGKYVNIDCQDKPMPDTPLHSYQFTDWAIDYYSDPEGKREFRNKLHSYKMK